MRRLGIDVYVLYHKQNQSAYECGTLFTLFTFVVRQAHAKYSRVTTGTTKSIGLLGNGCSGEDRRGGYGDLITQTLMVL